ncbi:MAG: acetyl-CoA carboxylase biotin carboxyl carrier protein [Pseudomonadota bacterium]|nr:acetyl-CoA carboxylase biotin carboxyl carrier protein [Pseudomonadota bacterium]
MASFDIDGGSIRKLAELLKEADLTEIEYTEGDRRIRVTRGGGAVTFAAPAPAAIAPAAAQPAAAPPVSANAVTSPMVGTAYLSPEPNAATFVKQGDVVKPGQTLLIIEAMKVMNPIKATKGGTVTNIHISNGQPVEFGEPLMTIE